MKKSVLAAIMIMFLCSSAFALNLDSLEESKPAQAPVAVSDCQDDPRLADLNAVIAEAQKGPLAQKLTLTPERYANMRPQVLQAIGDGNILICPDISIVAGIPSQAVAIDYSTLLKKYEWAIRNNNQKELQRLRATFKAAPMPAQAVASLATYVRGGTEEALLWAKALQIRPRGEKNKMYLLYIDLFKGMGGHIKGDPAKVIVLVDYVPVSRPEIVSIVSDHGGARKRYVEALSAYGFRVFTDDKDAIEAAKLAGVIK